MRSNEYHFISRWQVQGTAEEVSAILEDLVALPRWWPSVYLQVQELEPGDERGIGKTASLWTKGWLPYTLRWTLRVAESRRPHGFTLCAWGDFEGQGIWTLEQDGAIVHITYEWRVRAEKGLLRAFSFLLKPVFLANHQWAMAKGEESLRLELARRRAASKEERARIPEPPPPTRPWPAQLLLALLVSLATLWLLTYWLSRWIFQ